MKYLSELVSLFALIYIFGVLVTWFAFASIEHGDKNAAAFLKAMIWPYSVIEYNKEH